MHPKVLCNKMVINQQSQTDISWSSRYPDMELLYNQNTYTIRIAQSEISIIEIETKTPVPSIDIVRVLHRVNTLIMLLDGRCLPIISLRVFLNNKDLGEDDAKSVFDTLLPIYTHGKNHQSNDYSFGNYLEFMSSATLKLWAEVLQELGIVHQVNMYMICKNNPPVDFACAMVIQSFEPLAEFIENNNKEFKRNGRSLQACLYDIISQYGADVFSTEIKDNKAKSTTFILKNSRVRIAHIKSKFKDRYLSAEESVVYLWKLLILYRTILLGFIGVDKREYTDRIIAAIHTCDTYKMSADVIGDPVDAKDSVINNMLKGLKSDIDIDADRANDKAAATANKAEKSAKDADNATSAAELSNGAVTEIEQYINTIDSTGSEPLSAVDRALRHALSAASAVAASANNAAREAKRIAKKDAGVAQEAATAAKKANETAKNAKNSALNN